MLIEIDFHFLVAMQTNSVNKFLPSIGENQKVEVAVEDNEAVIKLFTYTENLGWNCQKTMRIDKYLLDDLHRLLSAARYRLNNLTDTEENPVSDKIIMFPKVA